jgi:hypothetical protein
MAEQASMSTTIYLIDTSYLIELFACGRKSDFKASKLVRERFRLANKSGGRFFVPLPCLFELGNHIADVKDDKLRSQLVAILFETVQNSLLGNNPWTITPTGTPASVFHTLVNTFKFQTTRNKVRLVDSFTLAEAHRLKESFKSFKIRIHIWTNNRILKRQEPDREPVPYLW